MPIQEAKYIWKNGEMIPWAEATTHVLSHALLYGTCAFEGIRAYDTPKGTAIFRTKEHVERLFYSARIYDFPIPYTEEEIAEACRQVVRENGLKSAYIRLNAYLGYGEMSPSATKGLTGDVVAAAFPFGRYLGPDAIENGIDVCVSSWRRSAPSTIPAGAKISGNYLSSRLITLEAKKRGMAEGIGLSHDGNVSEGGGENIFLVRKGKIYTPPFSASILHGITRDSVMQIAQDLGFEVIEQTMPRELLYGADELFFTGTAAEVTPIKSVDGVEVGKPGKKEVTKAIQDKFFGLFDGSTEDKWGWLDPVA